MNNRIIVYFILCFIGIQTFYAQTFNSDIKQKKKESFLIDNRQWTIEIPIWIPGFRGEFAYGDVEIEGEDGITPDPEHPINPPEFGDVFKRLFKTKGNLNYFFVTSISYTNKKFFSELDLFSGSIREDLRFRYNSKAIVGAKVHTDLSRLILGYRFIDHSLISDKALYHLHGYGGIRLHNFKIQSNLDNLGKTLNIDPIWIEPVIGLKNELILNYWKFLIQADMGSFGINDKFSYQLNLYAFYRISNTISIKGGWNSWYVNYENRFKNDDLVIKTHLAGPVASVVFNL